MRRPAGGAGGVAELVYGEPKHTHLNHDISSHAGLVELMGQTPGKGIMLGYLVAPPQVVAKEENTMLFTPFASMKRRREMAPPTLTWLSSPGIPVGSPTD